MLTIYEPGDTVYYLDLEDKVTPIKHLEVKQYQVPGDCDLTEVVYKLEDTGNWVHNKDVFLSKENAIQVLQARVAWLGLKKQCMYLNSSEEEQAKIEKQFNLYNEVLQKHYKEKRWI